VETSWTGTLSMPRGCGYPGACEIRFDLAADQIGLGRLSEWVSPPPQQRPWYRVLESNARVGAPFFAGLRATGRLTADRLRVQDFEASHVSGDISLERGKLQVSELKADFLGGKHRGEWRADFGGKPAVCSGSGSLTGISLTRLAETMKDPWITGTANTTYELKGTCPAAFWTSADGTLQFEVRDGVLPHISLPEVSGPLKVARFAGKARIAAGKIEAIDTKLDSASGKFVVSGTASLKQDLDLKLARSTNGIPVAGFAITGTPVAPRITSLPRPETQARLKPVPTR
jgi:hypothetical protein